jgi:hypothetical protein
VPHRLHCKLPAFEIGMNDGAPLSLLPLWEKVPDPRTCSEEGDEGCSNLAKAQPINGGA